MSRARGETLEEYMAQMRKRIPLGRTGTPQDTAEVAAFLCSPQAAYVTAEAINVSGGISLMAYSWPGKARLAMSFVINVEEGAEMSLARRRQGAGAGGRARRPPEGADPQLRQ